jgi:lipoprotein NlpD
MRISLGLSIVGSVLLTACASKAPAPVAEGRSPTVVESRAGNATTPAAGVTTPAAAPAGLYVVKKGDTLYRIALDHGLDYRELAAWNNIDSLGKLEVGQQLRLTAPNDAVTVKPIAAPAIVTLGGDGQKPVAATAAPGAIAPPAANSDSVKHAPRGGTIPWSDQAMAQAKALEAGAVAVARTEAAAPVSPRSEPVKAQDKPVADVPADEAVDWTWPGGGKVLTQFVEGGAGKETNKGIDLAGRMGEPVQAAAAGKVVYAGSGLRGYGNLVILRHNAAFLSAYAHNSKILVKEGQAVTRGQKIAEVGNSDADQPKLHFEIRYKGKPVDPQKYLPAR